MHYDIIPINVIVPVITPSRIDELLEAFIADQDVKESSKPLYKRAMK